MKNHPLTPILHDLAEDGIPAEVDYRAAVRARLETSKTHANQGAFSMKTSFTHPRRIAAIAFLAVLLLMAAALVSTPQGQAWAQTVLRFFTRSESNTHLIPTQDPLTLIEVSPAEETPAQAEQLIVTPTPRPEALLPFNDACGSLPYPRCTIEQIGKMVDFPVKGLAAIPEGMELTGASGGTENIIVMYAGSRGALYLAQGPAGSDDPQLFEISSDTLVEAVSIGNLPGEYIQGGWSGLGISEAGLVRWETHEGIQTLRWEQDGMRYTLWFYASKTGDGPLFDKSGLAALASQLTAKPASSGAISQAAYLTIEQAATRSGFAIVEPAWLPAGYLLAGATYAPEWNGVCLYYSYRLEAAAPTLTLFQSNGQLPSVEDIKIKQFYNGQPIDIPVSIAAPEIGGVEPGYALLASNGVNLGAICGGIEMTTNKALLWRFNGMSFVLGAVVDNFNGRGFLSDVEMRRVAESLTGVATLPADALDPERLNSVEVAKSLAGFEVKSPTLMLAGFYFDHGVYYPNDAPPGFWRSGGSEDVYLLYLGSPIGDGSDGRYASIFIAQTFAPGQQTLDELAMGGGYETASVNGQAALHRQDCWEDPVTRTTACYQTLTWFVDDVRYEIDVFLEKALPKDMLIAIAESMK